MARLIFGLIGLCGLGCVGDHGETVLGSMASDGTGTAMAVSPEEAADASVSVATGAAVEVEEGPQSGVVNVAQGTFSLGPPPPGADAGVAPPGSSPEIVSLTGPEAVTNGGSVILHVQVSPPVAAPQFIVSVDGDTGYSTVAGTDSDGDGSYDISVEVSAEATQQSLVFRVALIGADGNVGAYQQLELELVHSGNGDVKVTLSFDRLHDLDLHVIEPSGDEIFYQRPSSVSGGKLDLDSGANCEPSPANAENIFWPPGGAPAGTYKVSVQNYQQCSPGAIAYRVRIAYDAVVQTYEGSFDDGTAGEIPSATHVKQIATFERGH